MSGASRATMAKSGQRTPTAALCACAALVGCLSPEEPFRNELALETRQGWSGREDALGASCTWYSPPVVPGEGPAVVRAFLQRPSRLEFQAESEGETSSVAVLASRLGEVGGATAGLACERADAVKRLSLRAGLSARNTERTTVALDYILEMNRYEQLGYVLDWREEEIRLGAAGVWLAPSGSSGIVSGALRLRLLEDSSWRAEFLVSAEAYSAEVYGPRRASLGLFVDSLEDEIALGSRVALSGATEVLLRIGTSLDWLFALEGAEAERAFVSARVTCRF